MSAVRPSWSDYSADLIERLGKHGPPSPTVVVVGLLGYAVENDDVGVGEHERAMAKGWLERLVDSQGNPLDDRGRNAIVYAMEENALALRGALSHVDAEPDRVSMTITVLRAAAAGQPRDVLRAKMIPHAESYVDHLLDELYSPLEERR